MKVLKAILYEILCGIIKGLIIGGVLFMVIEAENLRRNGVSLFDVIPYYIKGW